MKTQWDHCKEIINTTLGLGFTSKSDRDLATEVYAEINGDFGLPTSSDLQDFKRLIDMLPSADATQSRAKVICIWVLKLYEGLL